MSYETACVEYSSVVSPEQQQQPWWRSNFFVSAPVQFGTWDGVFTTVIVNIFGVIVLLRSGWVVAQAGLGFTILIIVACGTSPSRTHCAAASR